MRGTTMSLTPLAAFNDDHEQYAAYDRQATLDAELIEQRKPSIVRFMTETFTDATEQLAQAAALREWE
jgi:hypothetical protein